MLTREELEQKIAAYRRDQISFSEFDNWFEANSLGAYADPSVSDLCASVDMALARYYFDHVAEDVVKDELANAIFPFVSTSGIRFVPLIDSPQLTVWIVSRESTGKNEWIGRACSSTLGKVFRASSAAAPTIPLVLQPV